MDRDLGDVKPYENVKVDSWNAVGKAQVFYASPQRRSFRSITRLLKETPHDLLYLNGFFNPVFTLRPIIAQKYIRILRRPTIVAPRGEFAESALALKRWKKYFFIGVGRIIGLFDGVIWHASTDFEMRDIERVRRVRRTDIRIAINITEKSEQIEPEVAPLEVQGNAALRVCFLSRIAPMKNLTFALNVLAKTNIPIQFTICGPKESSAYWSECQKLIDSLPSNVVAIYEGSVEPSQVRKTIARHDVFFVPTLGENFGHVFLEAFSAGVPVLVSDKTPWRGLQKRKLGWDIDLDRPEDFGNALEELANYDVVRRREMRASCFQFAIEKMESKEALMMNRRLFLDALQKDVVNLRAS